MQERKQKNDQSGRIAKIYDDMMKQIMPLPQKPPTMRAEAMETKPIEKFKEEEKENLPILIDSVT